MYGKIEAQELCKKGGVELRTRSLFVNWPCFIIHF